MARPGMTRTPVTRPVVGPPGFAATGGRRVRTGSGGDGRAGAPAWERNTVRPGHRFPRHAHADWSVAVVCGGAGLIDTAGASHEAPAGAITVLHPGEPHRSRAHPGTGLDYLVVTVGRAAAAELYGGPGDPVFTDRVIDDPGCAGALLAACEADGRRPGGAAPELA
ncbi:AraC family ligand binding domain-containing protein, partial [Actinomadura roseirufa]|uniref:AraC family ligand binding domain-containing protein n=1 Tax=Actinomadura roseirufa TaxID=2094049 RepID=UPI002795DE44